MIDESSYSPLAVLASDHLIRGVEVIPVMKEILKLHRMSCGIFQRKDLGVEPKIGGWKTPKMDGENKGKAYFLMDDLGVPVFLETPI